MGSPIALTTRPSQAADGRTWLDGIGNDRAAAAAHAFEAGERHHDGIVAGEADDLAGDEAVPAGVDHDARADRHRVDRTRDLHHQAANADDAAINIDAVDVADLFGQRLHVEPFIAKTLSFGTFPARA